MVAKCGKLCFKDNARALRLIVLHPPLQICLFPCCLRTHYHHGHTDQQCLEKPVDTMICCQINKA